MSLWTFKKKYVYIYFHLDKDHFRMNTYIFIQTQITVFLRRNLMLKMFSVRLTTDCSFTNLLVIAWGLWADCRANVHVQILYARIFIFLPKACWPETFLTFSQTTTHRAAVHLLVRALPVWTHLEWFSGVIDELDSHTCCSTLRLNGPGVWTNTPYWSQVGTSPSHFLI